MRRAVVIGISSLVLLACQVGIVPGAAREQAPVLFPADQFDAVDLVPTQSAGASAGLLESLGARADRFEPLNTFSENNRYRQLGRSVGRLKILVAAKGGGEGVATCTAALISPNTIITNYHCVPGFGGDRISKAKVEFLYLDLGTSLRPFAVDTSPVEANRELDYSILRVMGEPMRAGIQPVPINLRSAHSGESLFLIHHPAGQPQRLTRAFCRAHSSAATEGTEIRHVCDTLPGSSGSLIFADDDFSIVGIHYAGGLAPGDPSSFNRGTNSDALRVRSAMLAASLMPKPVTAAPVLRGDGTAARPAAPQPAPGSTVCPDTLERRAVDARSAQALPVLKYKSDEVSNIAMSAIYYGMTGKSEFDYVNDIREATHYSRADEFARKDIESKSFAQFRQFASLYSGPVAVESTSRIGLGEYDFDKGAFSIVGLQPIPRGGLFVETLPRVKLVNASEGDLLYVPREDARKIIESSRTSGLGRSFIATILAVPVGACHIPPKVKVRYETGRFIEMRVVRIDMRLEWQRQKGKRPEILRVMLD